MCRILGSERQRCGRDVSSRAPFCADRGLKASTFLLRLSRTVPCAVAKQKSRRLHSGRTCRMVVVSTDGEVGHGHGRSRPRVRVSQPRRSRASAVDGLLASRPIRWSRASHLALDRRAGRAGPQRLECAVRITCPFLSSEARVCLLSWVWGADCQILQHGIWAGTEYIHHSWLTAAESLTVQQTWTSPACTSLLSTSHKLHTNICGNQARDTEVCTSNRQQDPTMQRDTEVWR